MKKSSLLVLVLSLAVLIGGTRLPLFPNGDEVQHQDVALSVSEGEGVRAPSYEGTWIGEFYAHYPPLYFYAQAGILYIFGVSPYSVRFLSFLSFILINLGLIFSLKNWYEDGVVDKYLVALVPLLACTEVTSFHLARWGRMDMFGNMLGVAGLYFLSRYKNNSRNRYILISAIFVGLSISTHFQCIVYYVFLVLYLLVFNVWRGDLKWSVFAASVPPLLLVSAWVSAHGGHLFQSVDQLLRISELQGFVGLNVTTSLNYLRNLNASRFLASGGPALLLVLVSWLVASLRYGLEFFGESDEESRKIALFGFLLVIFYFLVAKYIVGINIKRSVTLLYPSLLVLSMSVSGLFDAVSNWTKKIISVTVVVQIAAICLYLGSLAGEWTDRAPENRMWAQNVIPKGSEVAGIPMYWYPFKSAGEEFRVIQMGFGLDKIYWKESPEKIKKYDFLILRKGHTFLEGGGKMSDILEEWEIVDIKKVIGNEHIVIKNVN